jgi:response regulator RpfG family c-di-GMP phosphodiesterase
VTSPGRSAAPAGVRVLDRLRDEGRITAPQYESFYHQAKRTGERVEEAILESGAMKEADLLKFAAALYQTRFVSTERLAKADIERATLELVPRRVAERLQCIPILYDRRAQTLSVVACDLEEDITKQLQVVTSLRDVRVLVARPAAIRAGLRRFYGGDASAFAGMTGGASTAYAGGIDTFDRGGAIEMSRTPAIGGGLDMELDDGTPSIAPAAKQATAAAPAPPGLVGGRIPAVDPLHIEMPKFEVGTDVEAYHETVNVLVTLLDASRADLRGHSSHVARLSKKLAERLSLADAERNAIVMAAYLHDVGKASTYHLTALNVSRFDGHRLQAQRTYLAPVRMFESARLPAIAIETLTHLYERFDGQGFPDRQAAKDIPLGARIVSLVETFADLSVNPKNPYRRTLTPKEAVDVCRQLAGQLFDPVLADLLKQVLSGTDAQGKGAGSRVLVVDPDREETAMIELRLGEAGHAVTVVRDRAEAEVAVGQQKFDLVLSELELGSPEEGFALLSALRADSKQKDVPFVFLTRKADRDSVARGFELGAADFLVKPASAELVVAKCTQLVESGPRRRAPGGLSGSLRDMALPEVIQALGNGRKTGLLRLVAGGNVGEIHFLDGAIANASYAGRAKEEAIYAMLAVKDGDFALDPTFKPAERVIQASTEALLLEGMRRIDEGTI